LNLKRWDLTTLTDCLSWAQHQQDARCHEAGGMFFVFRICLRVLTRTRGFKVGSGAGLIAENFGLAPASSGIPDPSEDAEAAASLGPDMEPHLPGTCFNKAGGPREVPFTSPQKTRAKVKGSETHVEDPSTRIGSPASGSLVGGSFPRLLAVVVTSRQVHNLQVQHYRPRPPQLTPLHPFYHNLAYLGITSPTQSSPWRPNSGDTRTPSRRRCGGFSSTSTPNTD
jgi:hypothetical protein